MFKPGQRHLSLERTPERGTDCNGGADAGGARPGDQLHRQTDRLIGGHALVAVAERVRRYDDNIDLVDSGSQGTVKSALVHDQPRVADTGWTRQRRHHRLGIRHLRDPLRVHEAGDLDPARTSADRTLNQFHLVGGDEQLGLILQTVAGRHFADLNPGHRSLSK